MKPIREILKDFEKCLLVYCKPMHDRLLPPLQGNIIEDFLQNLGEAGEVSENLREIFLWKNGIRQDGGLFTRSYRLCSFGVIPPLEDVITYQIISSQDNDWPSSLVPLVTSYNGEFLLLEADMSKQNFGMLELYCPTFGYVYERITYYDSIYSMIQTIIERFESGAFVYNNEKMTLAEDMDLVFKISTALNPNSNYWDDFR